MIKMLFLLLALIKHRKTFNIKDAIENNLSGYDERYSINETELYKINKHFNKYNLLKILEDKLISTDHKLKLIDNDNSVHAFNITQGGLFKDWDYIK